MIFFNRQLSLYASPCCSTDLQNDFKNNLLAALNKIDKTKIGRELLEKIASGAHPIQITIHPETEDCDLKTAPPFRTRAENKENSFDPLKGTASTIFLKVFSAKEMPRYFTQYHHRFCVSKNLISKGCGDSLGSCVRPVELHRLLFHELVHAEHNQKGTNQGRNLCVPSIYKNAEEFNTIELENQFAVQVEEIETGRSVRDKKADLIKRYGFFSPDNPKQTAIIAAAMSVLALDFLINKVPRILFAIGAFWLSCMQAGGRERKVNSSI